MRLIFTWQPPPESVAQDFEAFSRELQQTREPLQRSVNQVMAPSIGSNFASSGRPRWAPLAAFTVNKKGHATPLVETGNLSGQASSPSAWTVSDDSASLEKVPFYGRFHDFGFFNVPFRTNVPQRRWANLQESDLYEIAEVFMQWLDEIFPES